MKIWILFLGDFLWSQTEWTERTMTINCTVILLCTAVYDYEFMVTVQTATVQPDRVQPLCYYDVRILLLLLRTLFCMSVDSLSGTPFTSAAPRPGISSTLLFSGL